MRGPTREWVEARAPACGQPSKELQSRLAFFVNGKTVEFEGRARSTLVPCPACNNASEPPVQGPPTHVLDETSGSYDAFLREADGL